MTDKYEHIHYATSSRLAELLRSIGTDRSLAQDEVNEIHKEAATRLEALDGMPISFNNEQFDI